MTCQYWKANKSFCYLHDSKQFGNIVNILSAILSLIAAAIEFIIWFFVKDLELYEGINPIYIAHSRPPTERPPASDGDAPDGMRNKTFLKLSYSSNFTLIPFHFYSNIAPREIESSQPLLTQPTIEHPHIDEPRTTVDETPQEPRSNVTQTQPEIEPQTSNPTDAVHVTSSFKKFSMSSRSSRSSKYSPVYKLPENHVEELNLRLQELNSRVKLNLTDNREKAPKPQPIFSDINPSVGDVSDKESDINIRQLESSVSSLSGLPSGSSTVNSPEAQRQKDRATNWHVEHYETNF